MADPFATTNSADLSLLAKHLPIYNYPATTTSVKKERDTEIETETESCVKINKKLLAMREALYIVKKFG